MQIKVLLAAKSEAEFDAAWGEIFENFINESEYEDAARQMADWFNEK